MSLGCVIAWTVGGWLAGNAAEPAPVPPAASGAAAASAASADAASPGAATVPDLTSLRTQGILALAASTALGITSAVAFTTGLDIERDLRSQRRNEAELDALLNARTVAGAVAWPALLLSAASLATGVVLLNLDDGEAP